MNIYKIIGSIILMHIKNKKPSELTIVELREDADASIVTWTHIVKSLK